MANKVVRKKSKRIDGRSSDTTLQWMVLNNGTEWELWRQLSEAWLSTQSTAISNKLESIVAFFDVYLMDTVPFTCDVQSFFTGKGQWKASTDEFKQVLLEKTKRSDNVTTSKLINNVYKFIDWVIDNHFSEQNDNGGTVRLYVNPLEKTKGKRKTYETVHSPLPYRYICDLRTILCPVPRGNFCDWKWAVENAGDSVKGGDWFEVDRRLIDKNDKDCIWRTRQVGRKPVGQRSPVMTTIYEIWSPVSAMTLFVKLHLPLRTYQVRMLDSGEADSMRYTNGEWTKNRKAFALNQCSKGVFRRFVDNATGVVSTGLYISTNKTADQNKDEFERGYEIPWQYEDVLYWLEKLRNWQEKYNPINKPTDCTTLLSKHTGELKSKEYLSAMGHTCFLFRDAASRSPSDRSKPIVDSKVDRLWYKLLHTLEQDLAKSGQTLSDGRNLELIHHYDVYTGGSKTLFPLHSLRVSLITSYIMDAKLPLPVVSKLLAGHSRIIMTIYYTKLSPAVMQEKMKEADELLGSKAQDGVRTFLKDAEMRQIECKMAYNDSNAIEAALINRNPVGWENRHHGLCLAGGNTVRSDEWSTVAGCWNGGKLIKDSSNVSQRIYGSVPHGSENCVRCRWFITDARYLPALNAHLNFMSYKANEAANLAVELEGLVDDMDELKYEAECAGKPFTRHNDLQALQRRYEKQLVEADEYAKDWIATFNLIRRIIEIEETRIDSDTANKLVGVGNSSDIKMGITETDSELLHLALLCDDAEFFPDLLDEVAKTPAIERRTQSLSRFMMRKGHQPHLLMLDKKQQLISANAMMRQMALQANPKEKLDGYTQVATYLEMEQFMEDSKLLDVGMKALTSSINAPIKLTVKDNNKLELSKELHCEY